MEISCKENFIPHSLSKEDSPHLPVLLACRTSHFHSNSIDVASQNYRNLESSEFVYFLTSTLQHDHETSFIVYTSQRMIAHLKSLLSDYQHRIEYIDQEINDVIPLFKRSRLLVNNGNGIGAFAY